MSRYYILTTIILNVILYRVSDVQALLRKCCPLNSDFSFNDSVAVNYRNHTKFGDGLLSSTVVVLNSDTFKCVSTSGYNRLTTIRLDSLIVGFPQCTAYRIIIYPLDNNGSGSISCVDKHRETGRIVGVDCSVSEHHRYNTSANITTADIEEVVFETDRISLLDDSIYSLSSSTEIAYPWTNWLASDSVRPMKWPPYVVSLRKCCEASRSYDVDKQFCWSKYSPSNDELIGKLIKLTVKKNHESFVNVTFGVPQCDDPTNRVLTDRIIPYNRISAYNSDSIIIFDNDNSNNNNNSNMDNSTILSFDDYCVDMIDDIFERVVVRYCRDYREVCEQRADLCIRKCCPAEQMLNRTKQCGPSKRPLDFTVYSVSPDGRERIPLAGHRRPSYKYGLKCSKYALKPSVNPKDEYYLTDRGNVYMPRAATSNSISSSSSSKGNLLLLEDGQYCVDNVDVPDLDMNGTYVFACFPPVRQETKLVMIKHAAVIILSVLSSVFLSLTFLVYTCLPPLQNLHGKNVMCYVATLFLGYVVLSVIYLPVYEYTTFCISLGYTMLFAFLSAFCWMNVICYDIWSTFGAVKSAFIKKSGTRKRFILYRLYGWGAPLIWTAVTFACQFTSLIDENSEYKPDIRKSSCWFDDYGRSRIVFFIVPISLIIVCNTFLYTMTVIYCSKVRNAINNVRDNEYAKKKFIRDKNKLIMNTKLFVAMGINWIVEIISLVMCPEQRQFFLLSDLVNASVGILIFIIFVVKKKIINSLRSKISTKSNDTVCSNIGLRPAFSTSAFNNSMLSSANNSPCRNKA